MNAYYFRRNKTAVLGAIKAQLPFSEGKYYSVAAKFVEYHSVPYNPLSFEFSATASEQIK